MNLLDQLQTDSGGARRREMDNGSVCSRKACGRRAGWQLLWNNPRLHTPERRKIWLACGDHRNWLEDYLQTRGLWKQTLPLSGPSADAGRGEPE